MSAHNFWNSFIFRVVVGLGEGEQDGWLNGGDLLRLAAERGLLEVGPSLNDLSVLLLWLTCPIDSPLQEAAVRQWDERVRHLSGDRVGARLHEWTVLREALPPHLADVYLHYCLAKQRQRWLVEGMVYTLYYPALVTFLERLLLSDTGWVESFATPFFSARPNVLERLDRDEALSEEFLQCLYRQVRDALERAGGRRGWPAAARWPASPPAWVAAISEDEKLFLDRCLDREDPGDRVLLYLSFYAGLNVGQVTTVCRDQYPSLQPREVLDRLRDLWEEILEDMAPTEPG
jgi:hypothetical protein